MPSWSVLTSGWGKRPERERERSKAGQGRDLRLVNREKGRLKEGGQKKASCLMLGEVKEEETGI